MTRGLDGSATEPPHWSRWFRTIGVRNPEGEVVMKAPTTGPCCHRRKERPRRQLLSDQGWLWARGFEVAAACQLYRRIAHWLMKEPELEEERLTPKPAAWCWKSPPDDGR